MQNFQKFYKISQEVEKSTFNADRPHAVLNHWTTSTVEITRQPGPSIYFILSILDIFIIFIINIFNILFFI